MDEPDNHTKCETIEIWTIEQNVKLHKQLKIAMKALMEISNGNNSNAMIAENALAEIAKPD